ncbi:hypothetical protein Ciccas_012587 [Cichlidogyrus casuarinus]|uniref:Uncharacterized protein n=1 Tax=Cichlidogyrus casuarinus TaxID=1844966 RepID=A0ABD2PNY5_9PLAT
MTPCSTSDDYLESDDAPLNAAVEAKPMSHADLMKRVQADWRKRNLTESSETRGSQKGSKKHFS